MPICVRMVAFILSLFAGFILIGGQLRDTQKGAKGAEMDYPVRIGTKPADYVDEMRAAFDHGLYRAALMLAVAIPDICAALESESSRTNGERYKKWCDSYLLPSINDFPPLEFSSQDLYQVRNALLHIGSFALDKG